MTPAAPRSSPTVPQPQDELAELVEPPRNFAQVDRRFARPAIPRGRKEPVKPLPDLLEGGPASVYPVRPAELRFRARNAGYHGGGAGAALLRAASRPGLTSRLARFVYLLE